jgi:hypothetical protein
MIGGVRMIANDKGGTNNLFDRENAWTYASGAAPNTDQKEIGQAVACRDIPVGDTSHLEPAAVLSMVTFAEWAGGQDYCEIDVEVGRWGDAANNNNAQCVIQPFYNRSEIIKRRRPARVFVSVSLLLVTLLTSDCDGDR